MFKLLGLVSLLLGVKEVIDEKRTKPIPANAHFDYEAYWADIRNGMTTQEQLKKRKRGDYWTTKPAPVYWYETPIDTVNNPEAYEKDKQFYGEEYAEKRRKLGDYHRPVEPSKPVGYSDKKKF